MTSGYVARDLRNVCRSALLHSMRNRSRHIDMGNNTEQLSKLSKSTPNINESDKPCESLTQAHGFPCWEDFVYAINTSKPSQQVDFESLAIPRTRSGFGGYISLRKRVRQTVLWPITNPETFKRMGVRPPVGLLLYGPSGCGKTMLVQTLASETNMNFIPVKGPEIFSKYLGETEATLRRLFSMARQISPCILFFDEMDSIGARRGWGGDSDNHGSNGVNERVLSTLLNEMDGVEERTGVFVIGCTNQPGALDDALLRPGRLDQLIYVGYPNLQDRVEIINTIAERIPLPTDRETRASLARQTTGFSPADLEALFREATIMTLRRDVAANQVDVKEIECKIKAMAPFVQDRINTDTQFASDGCDALVPELYRKFQQER
ncbi:P-loop containing nucleoside triphosphate hydrolase protein [Mortierella sp. GBAus27b]|nr:P-loop containing nucleoside triphosphate hydrolase protein [Mortierella sp. GBAus27b]